MQYLFSVGGSHSEFRRPLFNNFDGFYNALVLSTDGLYVTTEEGSRTSKSGVLLKLSLSDGQVLQSVKTIKRHHSLSVASDGSGFYAVSKTGVDKFGSDFNLVLTDECGFGPSSLTIYDNHVYFRSATKVGRYSDLH